MRRAGLALPLLALALVGGDVRAGGDDSVTALLAGVTPREGLSTRLLHVVPLVCVAADARDGAGDLPTTASWEPSAQRPALVDLADAAGSAPGPPAIVPAGTLLLGGSREQVLAVTEPHAAAEARRMPALVCDVRAGPVEGGLRRLGPVAPLEQRKLLLRGEDGEEWGLLLRIQQIVAGTEAGAETVEDVLDVAWLRERAAEIATVLRRIPPAYAGRTRGHVAFFGHRPVEVVVARTPADYRSLGGRWMESLAVSYALWERALGLEHRMVDEPSPAVYRAPATRAVAEIGNVRPRTLPRRTGQRTAWTHRGGRVVGAYETDRFVIGITETPEGDALLLQAIEDGDHLIHPLPLREPGGRPVDEGPDITGGALTEGYLRRLMERQARGR